MGTTKYQFIIDLKEKVLAPVKAMSKSFDSSRAKVDKVNAAISRIESTAGKVKTKLLGLNKTLGGLPALMAGAFAISKVTSFGGAVVDTLAEFERFEAVLTNTLGSSSAAQKALADITEFANNTPFHVAELSDSFVKLANQNFTPSIKEMTKMGDLAASVGKDFGQLSEAFISSRVFEFEKLKAFGVIAKKEGDKISLNFKGQTTVIDKSSDAVTNYLLSLGEFKGVQGAAAAIAKTTGGQISNLSGKFTQLKLEIGQGLKPVISALISGLGVVIEKVRDAVGWVKQNSEAVKAWTKTLLKITAVFLGWIVAVKSISIVIGLVQSTIAVFVVLKNAIVLVQGAMLVFNAIMLANPIGIVIVSVTALVGLLFGLSKMFPSIGEGIKGFYDSVVLWFGKAWDFVNDTFIKPILGGLNKIKGFLGFGENEEAEIVKPTTIEDLKEIASNFKSIGQGIGSATGAAVGKIKGIGTDLFDTVFSGVGVAKTKTASTLPKLTAKPSTKSAVSKGVTDVVGQGKQSKIINISIKSLVEVLNVHALSVKERPAQIKAEVEKVFLELANNINHAS